MSEMQKLDLARRQADRRLMLMPYATLVGSTVSVSYTVTDTLFVPSEKPIE